MPEAVALLACVHSNLEALEAALADLDRRGISTSYCLGDVIGYGPDPAACIDLIRERCVLTIRGHHEVALLEGLEQFQGTHAGMSIVWTRELLAGPEHAERRDFLWRLPKHGHLGAALLLHGTPDDVGGYVHQEDTPAALFRSFGEGLAFAGHTHQPCVYEDDLRGGVTPSEIGHRWSPTAGRRAFVNVGSVGQPRDEDPRACYATFDGATVEWHRVPYDVERTRAKCQRVGLPSTCGDRLVHGR